MTKLISAVILAVTLMFGGFPAINFATAASLQAAVQAPQAWKATEVGARHRAGHHRYAYRRYYPYYYDRPVYYAPAPFVPFNFGYPLLPPPWW